MHIVKPSLMPNIPPILPHCVKREFVDCPVCGQPDMRREVDNEGNALMLCVNHACASNGGSNDSATKAAQGLAFIRRCCRVTYYPPDGSYPIEHALGAHKDQLDAILQRQEPPMNGHGHW